LDALPILGDILHDAPARLRQQLYDAFGIQMLYKHDMRQVTIWATITETTPATLAAVIAGSEIPGHAATATTTGSQPEFGDLTRPPYATEKVACSWTPLDKAHPG